MQFHLLDVPIHFHPTGEKVPVPVHIGVKGDGPCTILLLHGFGDNLHTWSPLIERLQDFELCGRSVRFVCPDLPGFGRSPVSRAFAADYFRNAAELALSIADRWPGDPLICVGNSLGGSVAFLALGVQARAQRTCRISGALLLSPATPRTRTPVFVRLVRTPTYRWLDSLSQRMGAESRHATAYKIAKLGARLELGPTVTPDPKWLNKLAEAYARDGAFQNMGLVAAHLWDALSGRVPEVDAWLEESRRVDCPIILARGEHDPMVSREELENLAEGRPRIRFEPLAGLSHAPQMEDAGRIAELVRELLDEVEQDASPT